MTCAGQRHALGTAGLLTPEAEDHLAGCATCFAWLERNDPVLRAFREARPPRLLRLGLWQTASWTAGNPWAPESLRRRCLRHLRLSLCAALEESASSQRRLR